MFAYLMFADPGQNRKPLTLIPRKHFRLYGNLYIPTALVSVLFCSSIATSFFIYIYTTIIIMHSVSHFLLCFAAQKCMAARFTSKSFSSGPSRRTRISDSNTPSEREDRSLVLSRFCAEKALFHMAQMQ